MSIFDKLLKAIEEGDVSEVEASWRNWNWEGKVNSKLRILVTSSVWGEPTAQSRELVT